MDRKLWISPCCMVLLAVAGGCPFQGLVYEDDMVGGYAVWATDVIEDAAIVLKDKHASRGVTVVPAMVSEYGWNNEFIIAKQRPVSHRQAAPSVYWYIIQVRGGQIHGPLSEGEFHKIRAELNMPSELSFTRTTRLR